MSSGLQDDRESLPDVEDGNAQLSPARRLRQHEEERQTRDGAEPTGIRGYTKVFPGYQLARGSLLSAAKC